MTTTPAGNEPHRPTDGGPLAPTAPGNDRIRLTRAQKAIAAFVGTGTAFIAALGFAGSYSSVTAKAHALGFGWFANWITIGVDAGIGIFLALDLLLTWLRMPYPLLRHIAWLLTAATIVFNASASWPNPLGVGMHAVIPVLFIAATEAARHAVGRIADITADKYMEGPPPSRWFLNPVSTFILWRRQRLWGIRTWDEVLGLERERRIYIGQLRQKHGRHWRRRATAEQMLVLALAKDGMSIQDAIDLPKREAEKLAEAEAKRQAEARAKAEAEAEAKHQADLRKAEVEAKRRAEIAEAEAAEARARAEVEAAEAEAKAKSEVATEAARLEVEAKRVAEAEAARLLVAETEAKLAEIARAQRQAEAEAELNRQRRAAEQSRLQAEAARQAREQEAAEAQRRREQELRERAQRIAAQATTTSASTSGSASGSAPRRATTSTSASGSVSAIGGRGAKKQAEVEAVLARLIEANDPKAYPLSEVIDDFGLSQTTAYDRLVTAQRLYEAAQGPKSEKSA